MAQSNQSLTNNFSSQQIVCIDASQQRLYGSVIQYIETQCNYWIRPLCLVENVADNPSIISLHRTSDLIIARDKLREALDTEVLEFWTTLYDESGAYEDNVEGRAKLHRFLRQMNHA
ncbi:MAG: hypothetical protein HC799_00655 [Limnothrix sp. RL_2_0]|nr:hypothetical protein [Limnothrix sp. RL_2_0]